MYNGVDASATTGNAYIGLSYPIRVNGDLKMVVAADVTVTQLYESLTSFRKRTNGDSWSGYAYLVDSGGYVALHPSPSTNGVMTQVDVAEYGKHMSSERENFVKAIKPLLLG